MTDFVLDQLGNEDKGGHMNYHDSLKVLNYAKFIKQPLKLEMFVPCDEEGNVLEKPISPKYFDPTEPVPEEVEQEFYNYDKAKEKVLFEGFEITHLNERISFFKRGHCVLTYSFVKQNFIGNQDVEKLLGWDLTLTHSAIKQFN